MTIRRLLVVQVLLVLGLGSVFLLPKVAGSSPQGIQLALPSYVNGWFGEDQKISEQELAVLAKDTGFARKLYTNGAGDQIFASIVLSGEDLNNSIHRPERCLPAQGWSIADSRVVRIPIPGSSLKSIAATRLHNMREVAMTNGETKRLYSLNYYWFVGANDITPSHFERTYIDIRDRLMHGYNQRWAYITIAATITDSVAQFGRSEAQTDAMIQKFIADLVPKIQMAGQQFAATSARP